MMHTHTSTQTHHISDVGEYEQENSTLLSRERQDVITVDTSSIFRRCQLRFVHQRSLHLCLVVYVLLISPQCLLQGTAGFMRVVWKTCHRCLHIGPGTIDISIINRKKYTYAPLREYTSFPANKNHVPASLLR